MLSSTSNILSFLYVSLYLVGVVIDSLIYLSILPLIGAFKLCPSGLLNSSMNLYLPFLITIKLSLIVTILPKLYVHNLYSLSLCLIKHNNPLNLIKPNNGIVAIANVTVVLLVTELYQIYFLGKFFPLSPSI